MREYQAIKLECLRLATEYAKSNVTIRVGDLMGLADAMAAFVVNEGQLELKGSIITPSVILPTEL